ncbi:PAS domain S-box protein [Streptomyces formicae]|uniref:Sensory box histidine kinase/response regulator n=1 Tax=Streptomyces formicae TaxID=1616117 RepID=A0A291Q0R1_9ACTN|nr:PAS domain S-box protein [Streptomyces formicae]ATL25086.1 Sensory box histidine kinase/response regulator [Streptomyces formicae]
MDDSSLKALLEDLPVFWWEFDQPWHVRERGGGAFADTGTAQRFLDRVRQELADPGHPPRDGRWLARFDGRTFDVSCPRDATRAHRRTRGLAVEVDTHPEAPRRYAAFADLVDLAPAAAFIRDRHGRYLWANHAYAHLYGTTAQELTGRCIEDFDAPEEAVQFRTLDQEILTRGTPVRHTLHYRRPDGSAGHAVGHRFPVRENAQTCVAGIYVDITDHLRAMVQRQEAEERLRALRDHTGLPCALLTAGGRVIEASAAAAELFDLGLPDLVGRRAHTLLAPAPGLERLHRRWRGLIARRTRRVETSVMLGGTRGLQRRARLHLTTVGHSADRAGQVWAVVTHQSLAHQAHPALTAAQIRILTLLAEGSSNSDIATSLKLSRQTVDYHLGRLRGLLGAPTRPALVARAYVLGILAPAAWPPRSATAAHPLSTV